VTEDLETSSLEPAAVGAASLPQPSAGDGASAPATAPSTGVSALQERAAAVIHERPEVGVGAAFGGGLILALILKRIAR